MFQKQIRMDFSSYDIELELAVPMKHARLLITTKVVSLNPDDDEVYLM
jgi:hypothetical protein